MRTIETVQEPRRVYAVLLLTLLSLVWLLEGPARTETTEVVVGKLSRFPDEIVDKYGKDRVRSATVRDDDQRNGTIIVVPEERIILQLYELQGTPAAVVINVLDADSLSSKGIIEIPGVNSSSRQWYSSVDTVNGRLFLGELGGRIATVDLRSLRLSSVRSYPIEMVKFQPTGLSYDGRTNRLYVLAISTTCFGFTGCPGAATVLHAINTSNGSNEPGYPRTIRSCRGTQFTEYHTAPNYGYPILSVQDPSGLWRLHIPCQLREHVSGVVVVPADDSGNQNEVFIPGPPGMGGVVADQAAGRLVLFGDKEGFVYDAASMSFIRAMPMGGMEGGGHYGLGLGLDPTTGVMFGLSSQSGLYSTHVRANPVPMPEVIAGYTGAGYARIWYDPPTSRLFALREARHPDTSLYIPMEAYDILKIPPLLPPPPPTDPDRNTSDVEEVEGVTHASHSANGAAYGVRVLLARGLQGAFPTTGDAFNFPQQLMNSDGVRNKCGFVDRWITLASIGTLHGPATLGNATVAAKAVEVDVDDATKVDLKEPYRCDQDLGGAYRSFKSFLDNLTIPPPAGQSDPNEPLSAWVNRMAGRPWGYRPAECSGDGRSTSTRRDDSQDIGNSEVSCSLSRQELEAASTAHLSLGSLQVGHSHSTVSAGKQSGKGTSIRVETVVRDIVLGDISIKEVRTVAEASSAGRRGRAEARLQRRISLVSGPGFPAGGVSCTNAECIDVITRLNAVFAGRAEFRFPSPDPDLCRNPSPSGDCKGTPGGAQSGIIKSEFRRISDAAMSGDSSREIPALEILIYNDNQWSGRARQLIQLAGVQATTSYNISALPPTSGFASTGGMATQDASDDGRGDEPSVRASEDDGRGLLDRIIDKVKEIARPVIDGILWILRNPREALRVAVAWALLTGPALIAVRRRRLGTLTSSTMP